MQESLKKLIVKLMRDTANKIDTGTCELSDSEAMDIISVLSHRALSKEQACEYLNLQRSRFDDLVRLNILPRGRKRKGFKELVWYEDELKNAINGIK